MCGLLQIVQRHAPVDEALFSRALSTMAHRGPDARGVRFARLKLATAGGEEEHGIGFGHQRLSILDLDPRSDQPFRRGSSTLLYNGEIYDFAALRADFPQFRFQTSGDTEVLMAAMTGNGTECLGQMNGMWAFVLTDEATGDLIAVRDAYGKKPLFYYLDQNRLILSSTIGAITTLTGRKPVLRPEALDGYLESGALHPGHGDRTHLRGIGQVPAGGCFRFDVRAWKGSSSRWFKAEDHVTEDGSSEDLATSIRDAVLSRLVSDRQVGLLLSGGIDSSLILSVIHSSGAQDRIRCFIGETGVSEDAAYARRCAERTGIRTDIVELRYEADSFDRFLRLCRHQEKPFPLLGNSVAMAEMYEAISAFDVPVVLDGTGGDEVFGGYWDRQYPFAVREAVSKLDLRWLTRAAIGNSGMFYRTLRRLVRSTNGRRRHPTLARFYRSPGKSEAPDSDPLNDTSLSFTEALLADVERGRLGEWIWQNDRNAMMHGIENRSPFLDHRLLRFAATGYANKFVGPWSKHELRRSFDAFTPLPTQWRIQKQGFRWQSRTFHRKNAGRIKDVISASQILPERIDVQAFLDAARSDEAIMDSLLVPRLLCIAGLEQATGMRL